MNNNTIIIHVDKSITGLAGYNYGKKVYMEQVFGKVDLSKPMKIVFPDNIQRMASSFIQGFFEDLMNQIGISGIENEVLIESSNKNLKDSILNNLL